jgi:DNA-binding NtrC family response regulator
MRYNSPGLRPLNVIERQVILLRLEVLGNNKTQTAISLGISLRTLQRKLQQYDRAKRQSNGSLKSSVESTEEASIHLGE